MLSLLRTAAIAATLMVSQALLIHSAAAQQPSNADIIAGSKKAIESCKEMSEQCSADCNNARCKKNCSVENKVYPYQGKNYFAWGQYASDGKKKPEKDWNLKECS